MAHRSAQEVSFAIRFLPDKEGVEVEDERVEDERDAVSLVRCSPGKLCDRHMAVPGLLEAHRPIQPYSAIRESR